MSETIKANEITPGMVIEWTDRGTFTRLTVDRYNPSLSAVRSMGGAVRHLTSDTDVEVISVPPATPEPEPETLGARVKAGNQLFLRAYNDDCAWLEVTGNIHDVAYTWEEVNEFGMVTVFDAEPYWGDETGDDVPERWIDIEEALKHCNKVTDRIGDTWYYVNGILHVVIGQRDTSWPLDAQSANNCGPFQRS